VPVREQIALAFQRARFAIVTVAITSALSVVAGALMVHSGIGFAVAYGDKIVDQAHRQSPILRQFKNGNPLAAAALDAMGNAASALATMVAGYFPPTAYMFTAFRGWVGGIVSIDRAHHSRLAERHEAIYYLTTLLLQLIPYTLTVAAGVQMGFAALFPAGDTPYSERRVPRLRIPYDAIRDAGWLCAVAAPLFFIASAFEFLMR
jgi:hypothetical protein